eukprot:SAG22_NODE_231_length_14551_cov_22.298090_3_plen_155_part_00
MLRQWIDHEDRRASGNTNFQEAFTKTFALFDASTATCVSEDTGESQNRMSVVLFMTDGDDTSGMPISRVSELNAAYNATVFTYSLGADANSDSARTKPKAIACANNGKWTPVVDTSGLAKEMETYFEFLQVRENKKRRSPYFSPPSLCKAAPFQ